MTATEAVELQLVLDEVAHAHGCHKGLTKIADELTQDAEGRHAIVQLHEDMHGRYGDEKDPPSSWRREQQRRQQNGGRRPDERKM